MKVNIEFQASYYDFQRALRERDLWIAMPPEWCRFWTKAKKGLARLRLANSLFFGEASTKFFDGTVAFERKGNKVKAEIQLKPTNREPLSGSDKLAYTEVIPAL